MIPLNENIIARYFAGECSDEELHQISAWLEESEANRKQWTALRLIVKGSTRARLSAKRNVNAAYAELCSRIDSKHKAINEQRRSLPRQIVLRTMAAAAAVLLIGNVALFTLWHSSRLPRMITVTTDWNTPVRELLMADGTKVWLSANSKLVYPETFADDRRTVHLEGKAYFEVAKDSLKPFSAETEWYSVCVKGTSFEVSAFRDRQQTDVTLIEGKVDIIDGHNTTLCSMEAGDQFTLDRAEMKFGVNRLAEELIQAWRSGKLEFDGLTLGQVVLTLEQYYKVQLIIDPKVNSNQLLVGSLSLGKDIREMMDALCTVTSVRYSLKTNTTVYIENK